MEGFYTELYQEKPTDKDAQKTLLWLAAPALNKASEKEGEALIVTISGGKKHALKDAPKRKTSGPDDILVEIYKATAKVSVSILVESFNTCPEAGTQILGEKELNVCLLYKQKGRRE